jgi:hypothetical protein
MVTMSTKRRTPANWLRSNLKLVTLTVVAALMIVALSAIIVTVPISEITVFIKNSEETETASIRIWLESSGTLLYISPGNWTSWRFHVSPGTHSIFLTSNLDPFNPNPENFELRVSVGFNGMCERAVRVNQSVIGDWYYPENEPQGPHWVQLPRESPIEQAIGDPYVFAPAVTLAALHVLLVVAVWNYCRTPAKKEPS